MEALPVEDSRSRPQNRWYRLDESGKSWYRMHVTCGKAHRPDAEGGEMRQERPCFCTRLKASPGRLPRAVFGFGMMAALAAFTAPATAQVCTTSKIGFIVGSGTYDEPANCVGLFYCHKPELLAVRYQTVNGCDPEAAICDVRAVVPGRFPSAKKNSVALGYIDSPVKLTSSS